MPSQKNINAVAQLTDKFKQAGSLIMFDYRGLNAEETEDLRNQARQAGVELRVHKNRLVKLALKGAEFEAIDDILVGPTAIAFGYDDPVAPAKLVAEFAKKNAKAELKGGILEGKALSVSQVGQLADAPTKEELLARFMRSVISPAQNFVYAVEAARSKVVHAVDAVRRQKEEAA